jgi:hypothetical protein
MSLAASLRLDIRNKKGIDVAYKELSLYCGVVCTECGWKDYRIVNFTMNPNQHLDQISLTDDVKGKPSVRPCPKCNRKSVVHTHALRRGLSGKRVY